MNRRIPPPVAFAIAAIAMWLIGRSVEFASFSFAHQAATGIVLIVVGFCVAALGLGIFAAAGTTPNPMRPGSATRLVSSGPYAMSRNPMYLADAIMLAGVAVWNGNGLNVLVLAAFVWYIDRFQIATEEKALLAIFGDEYAAYCRRVRRWL